MRPKILIVDDDPDIRAVIAMSLKSMGCRPLSAQDGEAGLGVIRSEPPDLILLDLLMPDMGGLGFLKEAKALHPEVPVIVLSGIRDTELAQMAVELGAAAYVTKPLDFNTLRGFIRAQLGAFRDEFGRA